MKMIKDKFEIEIDERFCEISEDTSMEVTAGETLIKFILNKIDIFINSITHR